MERRILSRLKRYHFNKEFLSLLTFSGHLRQNGEFSLLRTQSALMVLVVAVSNHYCYLLTSLPSPLLCNFSRSRRNVLYWTELSQVYPDTLFKDLVPSSSQQVCNIWYHYSYEGIGCVGAQFPFGNSPVRMVAPHHSQWWRLKRSLFSWQSYSSMWVMQQS